MSENFDRFNAPQFFDFSKDVYIDENVESYFEIDHENYQLQDPSQDHLMVPFCDLYQNEGNNCEANCVNKPRRSMSVGNLIFNNNEEVEVKEIVKTVEDTLVSKEHISKYSSSENLGKAGSNTSLNKSKAGPTKLNTSREEKRSASRDNLNRLAQPKKYGSVQNLNRNSYVSMAEAVKKFHSGTPNRFRTRPKPADGLMNKLGNTVPQSPALLTKNRHRPTHAISREEQERLDYEEAQKFKIKANPLNKRILQGPVKPLIPAEKKPATVVEPFKITSPKKQVTGSPKKETFHFHAKPVPKAIYEPFKLKEAEKVGVTMPQTPTFMKRRTKEPIKPQEAHEEPKPTVKLGRTVPMPFSFESRDLAMQKKREELIKGVLEEERKAREFHARPAPKAILNCAKNAKSDSQCSNVANSHDNLTKSNENISTQFKARPPTVLYKKPFEPKIEKRFIEITEFQLNTEIWAKQREKIDELRREKEEKIALAKQLEEELRLQKEEVEIAKLRKESVYKAQPVKKYKEIKIHPSGKVTEPKSPNLLTNRIRNKANKENEHYSN